MSEIVTNPGEPTMVSRNALDKMARNMCYCKNKFLNDPEIYKNYMTDSLVVNDQTTIAYLIHAKKTHIQPFEKSESGYEIKEKISFLMKPGTTEITSIETFVAYQQEYLLFSSLMNNITTIWCRYIPKNEGRYVDKMLTSLRGKHKLVNVRRATYSNFISIGFQDINSKYHFVFLPHPDGFTIT